MDSTPDQKLEDPSSFPAWRLSMFLRTIPVPYTVNVTASQTAPVHALYVTCSTNCKVPVQAVWYHAFCEQCLYMHFTPCVFTECTFVLTCIKAVFLFTECAVQALYTNKFIGTVNGIYRCKTVPTSGAFCMHVSHAHVRCLFLFRLG